MSIDDDRPEFDRPTRETPERATPERDPAQVWPDGSRRVRFRVDMSDDEHDAARGDAAEAEEAVGYRRPPKAHRFQPGRSGNPLGRPLGSKNRRPVLYDEPLSLIIKKEAYREITLREGGVPITLSMAQVVVRAIGVSAGKGNIRAQKLFTELLQRVEAAEARQNWEALQGAIEIKANLEREVARRENRGITDLSDMPLHPDDIYFDVYTGESGVISPEQRQAAHRIAEIVAARRTLIASARASLAVPDPRAKPRVRRNLEDFIERAQAELDELLAPLPAWILEICDEASEAQDEGLAVTLDEEE